jgi:hypothetical protein
LFRCTCVAVEAALAQQAYWVDAPESKHTEYAQMQPNQEKWFFSSIGVVIVYLCCVPDLSKNSINESSMTDSEVLHMQVFHCLIGAANLGRSWR